ncbi:MAG: mechanosensitive ion channel family protein [Candidatus Liptonbacteria bacterium]|nr:mechanosensitive ion channel family protein [Candidatus Liptonbacteria bacterium]
MLEFSMYITPQGVVDWLQSHGLKLLLIVVGAILIRIIGTIFLEKVVRRVIVSDRFLSRKAERRREKTLIRVFSDTLRVTVWIVATTMFLAELGVETGPLIAAAGILGIAIGFGSQSFVHDVISGLFIIIENQYRVGDYVCFDATCGTVEDITLRITQLRDLDGTVHHLPHGMIRRVSNFSKKLSRVNLNITVSHKVGVEKGIEIINRVGEELAADPIWKKYVLTPPQFFRIEGMSDWGTTIKVIGDTQPLHQWDTTGEMRRRLKLAFEKENLDLPRDAPRTV